MKVPPVHGHPKVDEVLQYNRDLAAAMHSTAIQVNRTDTYKTGE
jgi:hypothetical protein